MNDVIAQLAPHLVVIQTAHHDIIPEAAVRCIVQCQILGRLIMIQQVNRAHQIHIQMLIRARNIRVEPVVDIGQTFKNMRVENMQCIAFGPNHTEP